MKPNLGTIDRVIRLIIAAVIAVLLFNGQITGAVAIVLGIVAIAMFVTSIFSWCPAYFALHLSSRKDSKQG